MQFCAVLFLFCLWLVLAARSVKLMKNDHFLVFLAVWILFQRFLSKLSCELC